MVIHAHKFISDQKIPFDEPVAGFFKVLGYNIFWVNKSRNIFCKWSVGSTTVNRGHEHHLAIRANSVRERGPRCLGGDQPDGGTRNSKSSLTVQI